MQFTVPKQAQGKMLRTFLHELGVSAALCARLKRTPGGMLQNGTPVTVRAVLQAGDIIELAIEDAAPTAVVPSDLPIEVLCKTADYTLLNKAPGMPTHPSHGHYKDTLANALAFHFSTPNAPFCPRFINRLDRNTSGVVLVANHALAAAKLSQSMAAGEMQKFYLALVHGKLLQGGEIRTGIRRRAESIIFREVCALSEGEMAISFFEPLAWSEDRTLVRLMPQTGRTHQLRVHMAHLGYPLFGDDLYGAPDGYARHALHAAALSFPHPQTGECIAVRAPLPRDMMTWICEMGKEAEQIALSETTQD